MPNETHIELLDAPLEDAQTDSPKPLNVTQNWGQIKARASDRIFDHTPVRHKPTGWQIAAELVVAALILLLFL